MSSSPIYHLINPKTNDSFWTIDSGEVTTAVKKHGYADWGIKFYGGVADDGNGNGNDTDAMPVGDLEGWRQIFTEDFTTPAPLGQFVKVYGNRWIAYPSPWRDTSKRGIYNPEKVLSVANGVLDWHLRTENGTPYVGAVIPKIPGTPAVSLSTGIAAAGTGWHIASIEWRPGSLSYSLDGKLAGTHTSGVPSSSFHLVFQMETNIGGPAPSASAAGHIQLDWVSVYAPK